MASIDEDIARYNAAKQTGAVTSLDTDIAKYRDAQRSGTVRSIDADVDKYNAGRRQEAVAGATTVANTFENLLDLQPRVPDAKRQETQAALQGARRNVIGATQPQPQGDIRDLPTMLDQGLQKGIAKLESINKDLAETDEPWSGRRLIATNVLPAMKFGYGMGKVISEGAKAVPEVARGIGATVGYGATKAVGSLLPSPLKAADTTADYFARDAQEASKNLGLPGVAAFAREAAKPPEQRKATPVMDQGAIPFIAGSVIGGGAEMGRRVVAAEPLARDVKEGNLVQPIIEGTAFMSGGGARMAGGPAGASVASAIERGARLSETPGATPMQRAVGRVGDKLSPNAGNLLMTPWNTVMAGRKAVVNRGGVAARIVGSGEELRAAATKPLQKIPEPPEGAPPKVATLADVPETVRNPDMAVHLRRDTAELAAALRSHEVTRPTEGAIIIDSVAADRPSSGFEVPTDWKPKRVQAEAKRLPEGTITVKSTNPEIQAILDDPALASRPWTDRLEVAQRIREGSDWFHPEARRLQAQGVPVESMAEVLAHRLVMRGIKREQGRLGGLDKTTKQPSWEAALGPDSAHPERLSEIARATESPRSLVDPQELYRARQRDYGVGDPDMIRAWNDLTPDEKLAADSLEVRPHELGVIPKQQIRTSSGDLVKEIRVTESKSGTDVAQAVLDAYQRAKAASKGNEPRITWEYELSPEAKVNPGLTQKALDYASKAASNRTTGQLKGLGALPPDQARMLLPEAFHSKRFYVENASAPEFQGPSRHYVEMRRTARGGEGKTPLEGVESHLLRRDLELKQLAHDSVAQDVGRQTAAAAKGALDTLKPDPSWRPVNYKGMDPTFAANVRQMVGDRPIPKPMATYIEYMSGAEIPGFVGKLIETLDALGKNRLVAGVNRAFVGSATWRNWPTLVNNTFSDVFLSKAGAAEHGYPSILTHPGKWAKDWAEAYGDIMPEYKRGVTARAAGQVYVSPRVKGTPYTVEEVVNAFVPNRESVLGVTFQETAKDIARRVRGDPTPKGVLSSGWNQLKKADRAAQDFYSTGPMSDVGFKMTHGIDMLRRGAKLEEAARVVHETFGDQHLHDVMTKTIGRLIPFWGWQKFAFGKAPKTLISRPYETVAGIKAAENVEEDAARKAGTTVQEMRAGIPYDRQMGVVTGGTEDRPMLTYPGRAMDYSLAEQLPISMLGPQPVGTTASRVFANPALGAIGNFAGVLGAATGDTPRLNPITQRPYTVHGGPAERALLQATDSPDVASIGTGIDLAMQTLQPFIPQQFYAGASENAPIIMGRELTTREGETKTPAQAWWNILTGERSSTIDKGRQALRLYNRNEAKDRAIDANFDAAIQREPAAAPLLTPMYRRDVEDMGETWQNYRRLLMPPVDRAGNPVWPKRR